MDDLVNECNGLRNAVRRVVLVQEYESVRVLGQRMGAIDGFSNLINEFLLGFLHSGLLCLINGCILILIQELISEILPYLIT